jgi:Dolichyl-phosphate-mannose-protein mannosyltransferase
MKGWFRSGTAVVCWIALGTVAVHLGTGWRYGFDRDELMALEDARHLAWGYVQYPPMTAFFGRLALELFGTSLVGFRFFAGVAQALAVVLTGLMAREMGGGKWAQVTAALAAVPFCLGGGALMSYISFDYFCWVLVAYCLVRVCGAGNRIFTTEGTEDTERESGGRSKVRPLQKQGWWWVGVGVGVGLGMMAKYTMGFLVVGILAGVVGTSMRRWLRSGWFWMGAVLAFLIFLPNLVWEWRRGFVSLEFLRFLHVRDVGEGLTDWFLLGQLEITLLALPIALAGIWFCFFDLEGKRYRVLGWMYLATLGLFLVLRGRDYYLAPGYPMLYAAGCVWVERKLVARGKESRSLRPEGLSYPLGMTSGGGEEKDGKDELRVGGDRRGIPHSADSVRNDGLFWRWGGAVIWVCLILDILVAGAVALPLAPVNSGWWRFASRVDSVFPEEIGWEEFVEAVAGVRDGLPMAERGRVGILAGNYGEVGALNLYGERFGLPRAISGVNSSWERGYGTPAPETVIVAGYSREFLEGEFASCVVGGRVWNRYGILNEETVEDPEIFVCRGMKSGWEEFWGRARRFA